MSGKTTDLRISRDNGIPRAIEERMRRMGVRLSAGLQRSTICVRRKIEEREDGKARVKDKLSSFEGFVLKDFDEGRECLHVIKQLCAGCKQE